jgi:ATP-binding cassette, subfamily B, multidrug efflux pump
VAVDGPPRPTVGPVGPRPPMGRGPMANFGMPAEKSLNFGPSVRRLLGRLRPERLLLSLVLALTVASVSLSVLGPKLLGHATNLIFAGVLGRRLPAGVSRDQAIAAAKAAGHDKLAGLYRGSRIVPGQGVDFGALRSVLLGVLALYIAASVFSWLQGYLLNGVVQRTIFRLRSDVEDKLNRLPLRYFDGQPRGELLSRVTNDIDNIAQSLQQTISQLLTSALTVLGVLVMMLIISPLLALVAVISIPVSVLVTRQAVPEALRGTVAAHRCPERPDRGGLLRSLPGEGVRPPA